MGEPKRESDRGRIGGKAAKLNTSEKDASAGEPRLGEINTCRVMIRESKEFKETVNKLIKRARAVSAISSTSWEEQFTDAIKVPQYPSLEEEDEEEGDTAGQEVQVVKPKSIAAYVTHYLMLFWKLLFAFVPPPTLYNGWACFIVSIIVIGLLTALIGDLASHFGCSIGLKDSVTAISIVALGKLNQI